jgi:formiminoglutamate deiminase
MTTLHFAEALLADGWHDNVRLTLAGGRIAKVEAGVAPLAGDERHAVAVPGMPNLHSHAFQRAMAGLTETRGTGEDSFWSWRELMYRFALTMTPDDVEAVAAQLYVEMLEAGFTRVGEFHYLHHDADGRAYADPAEMAGRIAAASAAVGLKLTLLPVFYAHSGFGGAAPGAGLLDGARRHLAGLPDAVLGVAPHSLRAVTPEELAAIVPLAGQGPVHIHIAEQVKEVEDCLAWSGTRPVRWLLDRAPVDGRWCLIHATHMHDDEVRDMAARGAIAGLCPVTEANLGDGIFEGVTFRAAGGRFGVGSDSNVEIGVAAELRQLEYSQRLAHRARNVLADPSRSTGRTLYDAALSGGAAALGAAHPVLAEGAPADIVSLRADDPAALAAKGDRHLDAWLFAAGNRLIDGVWVNGVQRVADGRHRDRARIAERFACTMKRLVAQQ